MKFLILIALLFGSLTLAAQKTYFSDANLQKTKQKNAVYQITVTPQDSIFYVACENLNKQKLWQGTFKDKKLIIKHGLYTLFENNQKTIETPYKDNLKDGEERFFDNNGEIKEMQFYVKGTNITPVNFNMQMLVEVGKSNKNKPTKDKLTKYEIANRMDFKNVYGVSNKYGKIIVPMEYDRILRGDNSIIADKRGMSTIFDLAGQPILKTDYDKIGGKHNNTYEVRKDTLVGLLDAKYKVVIPVKYRAIYLSPYFNGDNLSQKVFLAKYDGNKYTLNNINEEELLEIKFKKEKREMFDFQWYSMMYDGTEKNYITINLEEIRNKGNSDDLEIVPNSRLIGIFSLDNTINIPYVFQEISLKHQKLPNKAKKNNKYGYIDLKGNTIIPFLYDAVSDFDVETQTAEVILKNKTIKINKKGVIIPPKRKSKSQFSEMKEDSDWAMSMDTMTTKQQKAYPIPHREPIYAQDDMSNTIKIPVPDYQVYWSNDVLQVKYKDILIGTWANGNCEFNEKYGIFNASRNREQMYLNPLLKPLFLFEYDSASFW